MDICIEHIIDRDHFGINFQDERSVVQFFFTDDSTYFPAFWIGNNNLDLLDEMLIYFTFLIYQQTVMKTWNQ